MTARLAVILLAALLALRGVGIAVTDVFADDDEAAAMKSIELLVTGKASGPKLYVRGAIGLEGDPWLAMRLPRLFALR